MKKTFDQFNPRMLRLRRQPQRFSFFQAMRDIESVADGLPRLGHASTPTQEAVRVAQTPNLDFAPSAIEAAYSDGSGTLRVSQRFFGMFGPSGALPFHMTELVRNRTRHAYDPTLQAFLNLFHHRMALLFYRAWSSSRAIVQRDRPWQDRFSVYVGSLAGYGLQQSRSRDRLADETKWFYTGRFASIRRNSEGLEAILSGTLQCKVRVQSFQLRYLPIEESDRSLLGRTANLLGRTSVIGRRVPDRQSCFELCIGPLPYAKFERLLAGQPRRKALEAIIRNYVGLGLSGRVRLVLDRREVPRLKLGSLGQLGCNAWLFSKPVPREVEDYCKAVGS